MMTMTTFNESMNESSHRGLDCLFVNKNKRKQ
jgi:hypothetical protein